MTSDTVTIPVVGGVLTVPLVVADAPSHDWSPTNLPWAYSSPTDFTAGWPAGTQIVDLQNGSSDFYTNLMSTVNAAGHRVVVRLQPGVYHLNRFRPIGTSGNPTYAFGFWFPNLQGFLGQGADQAIVQMDANSMSADQLAKLATMTAASFAPNQMGMCRFDGTVASPVLIGGVTFRSADQQMLTAKASDIPAAIPQSAPHNGVLLYTGAYGIVSHVRFQAAGRALTSGPPFEHGNAQSGNGSVLWRNCEFDGRRAPELDPAQPRRCGVVMVNSEITSTFVDTWFHHSNVSRYADNDQNRNTTGVYTLIRCKAEQISNTQNDGKGGGTNATPFGWESCNGTITVTDCIISQDNVQWSGQVPMHLQLTSVGNRNPQGGRMTVNGGLFHNVIAQLDGFVCFRIQPTTYWQRDGFDTTLTVLHPSGQRLAPYIVTGTWPPTPAQLAAAGVTPADHYLVRAA